VKGESVTVRRPGTTTDAYLNTITTWSSPTETTVTGCAFAPTSATEDNDGRTATITTVTLYMPATADVAASDRIVARGVTYEVDGKPKKWTSPHTGETKGFEVQLREVAG
jgi:hypothetical protein